MLRRKPTTITLTTEDVAIYEDARARETLLREQAALQARLDAENASTNWRHAQELMLQNQHQSQNRSRNDAVRDPNDELRPLPGDRGRGAGQKTREERLGLGTGGSSRH